VTEGVALFPLGMVLFPGQLLPLHIFEPRYRTLVDDLVTGRHPGPERGFGVVSIRVGRETGADGVQGQHALHPVGTFAALRAVQGHDDGRFDIVTQGTRRFRLATVDSGSRPYAVADVSWLEESAGDDAAETARRVAELAARYRDVVGARSDHPQVDDDAHDELLDPRALSYRVPTTTVLPVEDQQALLEAPDDTRRLVAQARLLRRELTLWQGLRSLPDLTLARSPIALN
jgi:uncharacterized protein